MLLMIDNYDSFTFNLVQYFGELGEVCRADFVVEQSVVVDIQAVDALTDLHRARTQAAVRLSGLKLGLLINFNVFPVVKGVHRIGAKP